MDQSLSATSANRDKLETLQAGRAFAALAVVAHHVGVAGEDFAGLTVPLLKFGYLGVDFFFVLSGFIIYHSTQGKTVSAYTKSRMRRVYLPYLPIGIGIALLYTLLPQLSASGRDWGWLPTLTLLPLHRETALLVAWTLKHEISFYLIFGVAYFTGRLWLGMIVWGAAIVIALLWGKGAPLPLLPINLEFLFGIGVAILAQRGVGQRLIALLAVPPIALWIALGANRDWSVLVGLGLAALLPPIIAAERAGRVHVPAILVFLGAASYSLYLIHGPVISVVARLGLHGVPMMIAAALAGVGSGCLYYWLVERPLLSLQISRWAGIPYRAYLRRNGPTDK